MKLIVSNPSILPTTSSAEEVAGAETELEVHGAVLGTPPLVCAALEEERNGGWRDGSPETSAVEVCGGGTGLEVEGRDGSSTPWCGTCQEHWVS